MTTPDLQPGPVRLRLTVTVDYDAEPADYGTSDPGEMARMDQAGISRDVRVAVLLAMPGEATTSSTVEPAITTVAQDAARLAAQYPEQKIKAIKALWDLRRADKLQLKDAKDEMDRAYARAAIDPAGEQS